MARLGPTGLTQLLNDIKAWVLTKIPTKTSQLTNDSNYLTSHQSLSNYSTLANTVKNIGISGKTITVTPGSGSAYTLTTQDTVYTHPTTAGNKHIPSGGSSGQFLGWDSDGTAKWVNNPNTDTKVTQNVSTTNASYPILCCPTAEASANQGAKTSIFGSGVKINPYYSQLFAGNYIANGMDGLRIRQAGSGKYSTIFRNDGAGTYILVTNENDPDGSWNDFRPLHINNATGICNITGNVSGSSGSCTGNAATATKATNNANGKELSNSIIKGLSVSGKTITYTQIDGTTGTITTQDTNTDTLMTQNVSTTNATYPILLCATANATTNQGAKTGIFGSGVKVNPSTSTISATTFSGSLSGNAATSSGLITNTGIVQNGITYTGGMYAIGNSAGQLYKGSSNNAALISAPENGTFWTETTANVQNLRFTWANDGKYLHDIFVSPNNNYIWHRDVVNGTAKPWRRVVEENATGLTDQTWSINIGGNAATATQFSANKSVTLTGDVTGTASSKAGWSVATTLANSGVTAGTYGPSADVTGNNNATISVPQITVDAKGRVTSVVNKTLTCKNNTYTVNNATLTIQKNGTNVATFTSNASANATANITVPTKTSELTNDSGFLTSHQSLSNYVTLNGTQTITGAKTFQSGGTSINIKATNHEKGVAPSGNQHNIIQFTDKNGVQTGFITKFKTSGYSCIQISSSDLYKNSAMASDGTNTSATFTVGTSTKGVPYWQAPMGAWESIYPHNERTTLTLGTTTNKWNQVFAGEYHAYNANAFMSKNGNYTFLIRNDGSTTYFLMSESGGDEGTWSSARPLTINNSTGICDINGTSAKAKGLDSSASITQNGVTYTGGTIAIGSSAGQLYKGSSNNAALISAPENGTFWTETTANVQNLRFTWANDGKYLHDIFVSPNNNYIWHRDVVNGTAKPWRRVVEENATGLTDQTWSINIGGSSASCTGNAATATTATTANESLKVSRQIGEGYVDILQTYQSDNNNYRSCTIRCSNGNGSNSILLGVHNESNGAPAGISVTSTNGTLSTSAPTPATSDNSTQIATTAFVKAQGYLTSHQSLANYLTKTTNVSEMGRYIDLHYDNATSKYDYDVRLYADSQGTTAGGGSFKILAATAYAPAPASDANDTRIATTKWVKDRGFLTSHQSLANYVTLNGTQTISGAKTFSSNLVYTSSLAKKHSSITKGTNPSSTAYWTIGMCDKDGLNAANNALGMFETSLDKNGIVSSYLRAYKNTAGSSTVSEVRAKYDTTNDIGWINCTGEDICLISNKKKQGTVPTANQDCTFKMFDNSSHTMFEIRNRSVANSSANQTYTTIGVAPNTSGAGVTDAFRIYAQTENSSTVCNVLTQNFLPISNNTYALGDNSHKWKSIHVTHPGATDSSNLVATTAWVRARVKDIISGGGSTSAGGISPVEGTIILGIAPSTAVTYSTTSGAVLTSPINLFPASVILTVTNGVTQATEISVPSDTAVGGWGTWKLMNYSPSSPGTTNKYIFGLWVKVA